MSILITKSVTRQFGWLLSFCCFSGAGFLLFYSNSYYLHLILAGFIVLLISWLKPEIFAIPAKSWLYFGLGLSKVTNPLLMGFIYFLILCPVSLFLKVFRKDLLLLSRNTQKTSYWNVMKDDETKLDTY